MEKYEINKYLEDFNLRIEDLNSSLNIDSLIEKDKEYNIKLNDGNLWNNPSNAQQLIAKSNEVKDKIASFNKLSKQLEDISELYTLYDEDEDIKNSIDEEILSLEKQISELEIKVTLNQKYDHYNCILELHPGAGGTEALDWANMLFRMYSLYCQKNKYKMNVISLEPGEVGIKSVSVEITGPYAYGMFKGERGVHRLVRISPFDSNKRRHTTFVSCDVAPMIPENESILLNEEDIRVDTFCSSGPGGQGVNTTYSAVRLTHIPTGTVVSCQNERSQIKNKELALRVLKSKLMDLEIRKQEEELKKIKGEQLDIGFGSQIRSYVFCPYTLVKDHRTGYESGNIESVMNGDLNGFIKAYLKMNARS